MGVCADGNWSWNINLLTEDLDQHSQRQSEKLLPLLSELEPVSYAAHSFELKEETSW